VEPAAGALLVRIDRDRRRVGRAGRTGRRPSWRGERRPRRKGMQWGKGMHALGILSGEVDAGRSQVIAQAQDVRILRRRDWLGNQHENFGYNHAFPTDQSAADLYDPEGKY